MDTFRKEFAESFPGYNAKNLATKGVHAYPPQLPGDEPQWLVSIAHPIFMRALSAEDTSNALMQHISQTRVYGYDQYQTMPPWIFASAYRRVAADLEHPLEDAPQQEGSTPECPKLFEATEGCCVCMDALPDMLCVPCGHQCLCKSCATSITACPLCRSGAVLVERLQLPLKKY